MPQFNNIFYFTTFTSFWLIYFLSYIIFIQFKMSLISISIKKIKKLSFGFIYHIHSIQNRNILNKLNYNFESSILFN